MADVVPDIWKEALVQCAAKSNSEPRNSFVQEWTD
jgi:hypothetical protein